jgi:hypothetical protein
MLLSVNYLFADWQSYDGDYSKVGSSRQNIIFIKTLCMQTVERVFPCQLHVEALKVLQFAIGP